MPAPVVGLLQAALVAELTVGGEGGRLRTDPMITFWDGRHILMTSSILFSRKLQDIKANPRVSLSLSDPVGVPANPFSRATIQGDARVIDEDLHQGWLRVLPLWEAKEPIIKTLLRSEEHTSELQSRQYLVCRLLLEKKTELRRTLLFLDATPTITTGIIIQNGQTVFHQLSTDKSWITLHI